MIKLVRELIRTYQKVLETIKTIEIFGKLIKIQESKRKTSTKGARKEERKNGMENTKASHERNKNLT